MKIFIILSLLSFNLLADNSSCSLFAKQTDNILNRIALLKSRDINALEFWKNQELIHCEDNDCKNKIYNDYQNKISAINDDEKNAIITNYKNLAEMCKEQ